MNSKLPMLSLWIAVLLFAASCSQQPVPPVAEKIAHEMVLHGDTRIDFYYWMNQRDNPAVIAYLEAENHYLARVMRHTQRLQNQLFEEMKGRIKQDDSSAPFYDNGYFYYVRYEHGGEYPIYCRRKGNMEAPEEIILNVPVMAASYSYYNVGSWDVSLDNRFIAFSADTMGRRQYTLYIKDLQNNQVQSTGIEFAAGDVVWAADNQTLFYTTIDPATLRYERVFRFNTRNGMPPVEVYFETDETYYYMGVSRSKDNNWISINIESTLSNETLLLPANEPEGSFRVFNPRRRDLLYYVEPYHDTFFVLTNHQAQNFRLMETPKEKTSLENWREVIGHRTDVLIEAIEVFNDFLVVQERNRGLRQMRIIHHQTGEEHYLDFHEEAYTAGIHINTQIDTQVFRFSYTSLTTPSTIFDYDMITREQQQIWQQTVLGDFNPEHYETRRMYVKARDGVNVPLTLVYKKGIEKNGNNPLLQYAYGSYGSSIDPRFSSNLISLLDRGFVYAMAHVRGGQEMGRQWYEDGKLLNKINTFNDFIDISEYLIAQGYTSPEKLFASGGSAGGLLIGAVINMRPDLYKGVIAAVPFVDVVTTMLDETIPLTTSEYDEWGNPNIEEYYWYMLSYSPYDQVRAQDYPNVLITSGLHDSQVQYFEPTKWAAKLREHNTANTLILLSTNMEAGHGGASGRFRRLKELAQEYAFMIDLAGK